MLLLAVEVALLAALFEPPPKQHSDSYRAAKAAVERDPSPENYEKLGRLVQEEINRPAWKDPVAVHHYWYFGCLLIVNGLVISRLFIRIGLKRDPIRIRATAQK